MDELVKNNKVSRIQKIVDLFRGRAQSFEIVWPIGAILFAHWSRGLKGQARIGKLAQASFGIEEDTDDPGISSYVVLRLSGQLTSISEVVEACELLERAFPAELHGVLSYPIKRLFERFDPAHEDFLYIACDLLRTYVEESENGSGAEIFDDYFEVATAALSQALRAPQLSTPEKIGRVLSEIVQAKRAEAIYDPCAGTGQLLLSAAKFLPEENTVELSGWESNRETWALAKLNLVVHGYSSGALLHGSPVIDAHANEAWRPGSFDVVVSNPPWGLSFSSLDKALIHTRFGTLPKTNADYAFILHAVDSIKPATGRAAVLVSNGALFRQGSEGKIRQQLCEENLVDAVIGLPEKIFENTNVATSILILRKDREEGSPIFFMDVKASTSQKRNKKGILSDDAVKEIIDAYNGRRITAGISELVNDETVAENGYSLLVSRYVRREIKKKSRNIDEILRERRRLEEELKTVGALIDDAIGKIMLHR